MQKILTYIGFATVVFGILYFLIYSPYAAYQEMENENHVLKKRLSESQEEVKKVYERFDQVLKYYLPDSQVNAIYADTKFFEKTETKISVTESGPGNYTRPNY